jgi:hypothetical protein
VLVVSKSLSIREGLVEPNLNLASVQQLTRPGAEGDWHPIDTRVGLRSPVDGSWLPQMSTTSSFLRFKGSFVLVLENPRNLVWNVTCNLVCVALEKPTYAELAL